LLCIPCGLFAGSLEYRYAYGYTLAHRKVMAHFYERHYGIHEINWLSTGKTFVPWKQHYHFPKIGCGIIYSSMGQTTLIGNSYAIYPFLSFERGKKVKRYFRVGSGLGYISHPFHREFNHKNIAIGSHVNAFIRLEQGVMFRMGKSCAMSAGISLSHFSNGSSRTPNLGINVITAQASFRFDYKKEMFIDTLKSAFQLPALMILPSGGFREINPAGGARYAVINAAFYMNIKSKKKGNFFAGADVFYSSSLRRELLLDGNPANDERLLLQLGIHGGYQFVFNRFTIPVMLGVYAFDRVGKYGLLYQSLALRYHVSKHYFLQVNLKSHQAKAEYFTYGIGYSL
jgi:hypothetical protein